MNQRIVSRAEESSHKRGIIRIPQPTQRTEHILKHMEHTYDEARMGIANNKDVTAFNPATAAIEIATPMEHDHPGSVNVKVERDSLSAEDVEIMSLALPGGLSVDDLAYRKEREAVVTAGVNSCIAAGRALFEIKTYHDGALWKEFHSFEEYCRAKWNYQKSQAYRLVDTGEFITDLETGHSPRGENLPVNEGQVRPLLANVPRELRVECWQQIVKEKPSAELTSTIVGTEVRKFLMEKGIETMRLKSTKVTEKPAMAVNFSTILREVEQFLTLATLQCPDDTGGVFHEFNLKISPRHSGTTSKEVQGVFITTKTWDRDAVAARSLTNGPAAHAIP